MKKSLRFFAFAGVGLSSMVAVVAACDSDDTVIVTPDSGVPDSTTPPTPPGPFVDAGDAGDASLTVPDFVALIESETCHALTRCCFGNADMKTGDIVDAGEFPGQVYKEESCKEVVRNLGIEYSAVGSELVDGGTVTVDSAQAQLCIDKLKALTCLLPATELQSIRAACFAALKGSKSAGDDCVASVECPEGHFCNPTTSKCAPLSADGGPCNFFENVQDAGDLVLDSIKNEEACSTRGSGDTNLRCTTYDLSAPDFYRPRDEWKCAPTVANDSDCNSTVWCAEGICDITNDDYICRTPVDYFKNNCGGVVDPE